MLLCCHWARESEIGGGRRELEGERGTVGEKDRVLEESLAHMHTHTYIVTSAAVLSFFLE